MTIYFGVPGALITLNDPKGGLTATRTIQRSLFQLDNGGVRMAKTVSGRRRYVLAFGALTLDDYLTLQAYEHGHWGAGPFALWDTSHRNLLNVRQSSATSSTGDTSGFSVLSGTGILQTQAAVFNRGPRSLGLFWGAAASGDQVFLLDPVVSSWYGVPVVVGLQYTFSWYARGFGSDPLVTLTPGIEWRTSTGSSISTSSGSGVVTNGSGYQRVTVTGTAPATAAYARCRVTATGSTIGSDSNLSLDQFQFEQAGAASSWVPGMGLYPVDFAEPTPDEQAWALGQYRTAPVLTLQEVG